METANGKLESLPQVSAYEMKTLTREAAEALSAERLEAALNKPVGRCAVCGNDIKRNDTYEIAEGAYWCANHTARPAVEPDDDPFAGHGVGCAVGSGLECDCRD